MVFCRYCVHRVLDRPVEPEELGGSLTVDGVGGAGEGTGSQRASVHPCGHIANPFEISTQRPGVGEEMVTEKDRLAALEVGVAGQQDLTVRFHALEECVVAQESAQTAPVMGGSVVAAVQATDYQRHQLAIHLG